MKTVLSRTTLLGLLALTTLGGSASARTLSDIRSTKSLIVGINGGIPTFQYTVERTPMGFEIDFIKMIAAQMGVEPVFQPYPSYVDMQKALTEDKIDLFIGTVAATSTRDSKFDLTKPYACLSAVVLTTDPNIKIHTDLKGKTIGLIKGTVFQSYVEKLPFEMNLKYYNSVAEATQDFGRNYDATIGWKAQRAFLSKVLNRELQDTPTLWSIPVSMMVANGNNSLRAGLNTAIKRVQTDPKFATLDARYFPNDSVVCK